MKTCTLKILLFMVLLTVVRQLHAQITVEGLVIEEIQQRPVSSSAVALYKKSDNTFVASTLSNQEGNFIISNVTQGDYYIHVRFPGYEVATVTDLHIASQKVTIGTITLTPNQDVAVQISSQPSCEGTIDLMKKRRTKPSSNP